MSQIALQRKSFFLCQSTVYLHKEDSIDPKNYPVPNSPVTVSLQGTPPYGLALPERDLLQLLIGAVISVHGTVMSYGDRPVYGEWAFTNQDIQVNITSQLTPDYICKYSDLENALQGLVDIMVGDANVGPVAAKFAIEVEGHGQVAEGSISAVRPLAANAISTGEGTTSLNGTAIVQGPVSPFTLGGGVQGPVSPFTLGNGVQGPVSRFTLGSGVRGPVSPFTLGSGVQGPVSPFTLAKGPVETGVAATS